MKLDLSLEFLMILFLGEIETKIDFFFDRYQRCGDYIVYRDFRILQVWKN